MGRSEGFDVSPDGKEIWVANAGDGTVSIIDFAGKQVTQTFGSRCEQREPPEIYARWKARADLGFTRLRCDVIDAASRKTIKRIAVGHGSAGIVVQPDGGRAFVACSPDGYVAVIDLRRMEVVGHIAAGENPNGMAWVTRR